jgi:hypothetical protein
MEFSVRPAKRNQRLSLLKQPISSTLNQHLIDYPTPSNRSYWWGFGSLAGICLVIQIVTGVFLAMHYTPHVDLVSTISLLMENHEIPMALGQGAPAPMNNLPDLNNAPPQDYDLNLPPLSETSPTAEIRGERYTPLFPLVGSLSLEEQEAVARFIRLENGIIRTATFALESVGYSPQPDDVRNFVEIFLIDFTSDKYEAVRLGLMKVGSDIFNDFCEAWENHLVSSNKLLENLVNSL